MELSPVAKELAPVADAVPIDPRLVAMDKESSDESDVRDEVETLDLESVPSLFATINSLPLPERLAIVVSVVLEPKTS